jgi:hypothetical protein
MSRFYGSLQGSRGMVTRLGGASSGIESHARGWHIGVRVVCYVEDGQDMVRVDITGGSSNPFLELSLGTFTRKDGKVVKVS